MSGCSGCGRPVLALHADACPKITPATLGTYVLPEDCGPAPWPLDLARRASPHGDKAAA